MGAARLQIRVLGPVRIDLDGVPLAVDTRKATALLAYLAVSGRQASREVLAALLWPESGAEEARGALRRTLSVLKSALGGVALDIDRTAVSLDESVSEVDLRAFRLALARARDHHHAPNESCAACLRWLTAAAGLDRGEFMEGFALRDSEVFDEWQRAEAEAHRRDRAGALERLARMQMAAGQWEAAIDAGRRWLELDFLHEPAHRLLMAVLARSGEPAAAIRQYRECVRVLDAELGVTPLPETTELYEAIRAGRLTADGIVAGSPPDAPGAGAVEPGIQLRPQPLVGRERDLAILTATVGEIARDGRLLVIEGEPGIGKTRLAGALAERVRAQGGIVLEARAYAGEAAIPFGPVVELIQAGLEQPGSATSLRSVKPELLVEASRLVPLPGAEIPATAAVADPFGRARLLEALADLLAGLVAGPVPGMLVLDDVHLADDSTIEVAAYLARRLRGRPIALVVTWRTEELAEDDRERILAVPNRHGMIRRVALDRFDRGSVAELATAALGSGATDEFVDALLDESEGLPLYVAEVLATPERVRGVIPGGVQALLRARIAAAGDVAGQILAAAAVLGRSFDLETVRLASGRSEDETIEGLEELVRRGLVREVPTTALGDVQYDFTHGGLRDVAYEALGLARRRLLHRRAAEAIAGSGRPTREDGVRWPLIALHETLAGRSAEAAEAHRRAGDHARSVFANHEAREHLETALALGHPAAAVLHETLGSVVTLLGDYAAAIGHLESAAALAGPGRQAAIEHALALVHARRGDWARAESHAGAAFAAAPDDPVLRSAILADRSAIAGRLGDPVNAVTLAEAALAVAAAAGDTDGIARAEDILGILARRRGDILAAGSHLERAVAAAAGASDPGLSIASLNSLALVCADAGDPERAMVLTRDALRRCERQGDRHHQAALENNLADLLRSVGRRDEAMDHLKRAVAIFADVGGRPGELEPEIWKLVDW